MDFTLIATFLALGSVIGLMAGLLGIGGGAMMVPALTAIFIAQGVANENVLHLALGTSMASIVITSWASMRAHHSHDNVLWHVLIAMLPGIAIGALLGTWLASIANTITLATCFTVFMMYVAVQMFWSKSPHPHAKLPERPILSIAGGVIAGFSSLLSIGGGLLSVPYLLWHQVDMKKAVGTAAAIGFPISIAGSLGYAYHGFQSLPDHADTLGFIYVPGVIFISLASIVMVPMGANLAQRVSVTILKRIFAVLLLGLSINMFTSLVL